MIINTVYKVKPIPAMPNQSTSYIEITTGISAPPIGIIKRKPIKNETANNIQNKFDDCVEHNK